VETAAGPVEYDLTPGDGPIVLASHGGWGGLDQARVLLDWLAPAGYRLLSVSRPGYLATPLSSGRTMEEQADLFAALLDTLGIDAAGVLAVSSGGPPGYLGFWLSPHAAEAQAAARDFLDRHQQGRREERRVG
jgi:pimeloyl-ACP methyl ester carboxylesterase